MWLSSGFLASSHDPLPSPLFLWQCLHFRWWPFSLCSCPYIRGLDGLHRSPGSVSSGAGPSCFSSPSALPLLRHCFSIQGSLLCPFHSSASLPWVLAPVSAFIHSLHLRMRRWLADWLIQSSSRASLVRVLQTVLFVCHVLGIVIPPLTSTLVPSQVVRYLSVQLASTFFLGFSVAGSLLLASVTSRSISVLRLASRELMALAAGSSSSLAQLVPDDRLRLRSLQLWLHRSSDRLVLEAPVSVSQGCLRDLL